METFCPNLSLISIPCQISRNIIEMNVGVGDEKFTLMLSNDCIF